MNVDEILNRHSLKIEATLKESKFKKVLLVKDDRQKQFILKIYLIFADNYSQKTERNFLLKIKNQKFNFLIFPQVIDYGNNYLLINCVPRIEFAKKSIAKNNWSKDNISLIVSALREFQNINLPENSFYLHQKILGPYLPAFKLAYFSNKINKKIHIPTKKIHKLIFRYIYKSPQFRKTISHRDLQISNFTFHHDYRKMSMIDFERLHVRSDPLLDILNYLITASSQIDKWTFQSDILKEYLNAIMPINGFSKGLADRVKLILLFYCCSYFLSVKNSKIKDAYLANIRFLSSDDRYQRWLDSLLQQVTDSGRREKLIS